MQGFEVQYPPIWHLLKDYMMPWLDGEFLGPYRVLILKIGVVFAMLSEKHGKICPS